MPRGLNDGGPFQFSAAGHVLPGGGGDAGARVERSSGQLCGKGTKTVLIPLPPAVGRAIDRAVGDRPGRPILLNTRVQRPDRHAAARRLHRLVDAAWTGFRL
jgi:hypothetical protein